MRKTTRILAVVLTLVMLVGALATAIFASQQPDLTPPDGVTNASLNNFEGKSYVYTTAESANPENDGNVQFVISGRRGGKISAVSTTENTYLRIETTAIQTANSGYVAISEYGGYGGNGKYDTDFGVLDFDLCADQYRALAAITGKDGTAYVSGDLIPADNLPADADPLAYTLSYHPSAITMAHNLNYGNLYFDFEMQADNSWVIKFNNVRVPLSNNVGEWNHITIIIDETKSTVTSSMTALEKKYAWLESASIHFYLNGEYVSGGVMKELGVSVGATNNQSLAELRFEIRSADKASVAIDNVVGNKYLKGTEGYTGPLATAFANGNVPKTIFHLSDTTFGNNYTYCAPNTPVANTNGTVDYYTTGAALYALAAGDVLTLNDGITVTGYVPEFEFDVVCAEGAFSIQSNDYSCVWNGSGYNVKDASAFEQKDVYVYDKDDSVIAELKIAAYQSLDLSSVTIGSIVDMEALTYMAFNGWTVTDDSDIEYALDHVFTEEEISAISSLTVRPVYDAPLSLLYTVTDADGNYLTDDMGDFANIENLKTIITANSGKTINVKLLTDIEHIYSSAEHMFVISGDSTVLNIDLAGHTWKAVNSQVANYFRITCGTATINVYSTAPNGAFYYITPTREGTGPAFIDVSFWGRGTTVTANFGTIEGIEGAKGENLTVMTQALFTTEAGPYVALKCNINGGSYYRSVDAVIQQLGFIGSYAGTLDVDIRNAFIKADPLFGTGLENNTSARKITATVDNSTIIAGSVWNQLFMLLVYFNEGSNVTFTNSNVIGSLEISTNNTVAYNAGTVTMGKGTYFYDCDHSHGSYANKRTIIVADDAVRSSSTKAYDFSAVRTPLPVIYRYRDQEVGTVTSNIEKIIAGGTYADADLKLQGQVKGTYTYYYGEKKVVNVSFKDLEGNTVAGKIENGVAVGAPEIGTIGATPFFTVGFTGWAVEGTNEIADFALATEGTVYVPLIGVNVKIQAFASMRMTTRLSQYTYLPYVADGTEYTFGGKTYTMSSVETRGYYGTNADLKTTYNGVEYRGYAAAWGQYGTNALTGTNNLATTITFKVTVDGVTTSYEAEVKSSLSQIAYLEKALEASRDDATKVMLANAARYTVDMYNYWCAANSATPYAEVATFKSTIDTKYGTYYKDYADLDIAKDAIAIPEELAGYVDGVRVILAEGGNGVAYLAVKLNATNGSKVTNFQYSLPDFAVENDGKLEARRWSSQNLAKNGNIETSDGYKSFNNDHMPAYALGQTMKITVTYTPDGATEAKTVEFNYSLAAYVSAIEETNADAANVLKSLLAFSDASREYIAPTK